MFGASDTRFQIFRPEIDLHSNLTLFSRSRRSFLSLSLSLKLHHRIFLVSGIALGFPSAARWLSGGENSSRRKRARHSRCKNAFARFARLLSFSFSLKPCTLPLLSLKKKKKRRPAKRTGKYQVSAKVTFLIVAYSVCSSMLLILNKVAVTYLPAPSFILLAQLSSCALFIRFLASTGVVECEKLEKTKAKKFALIVFGFIGTLFANVSTLKHVPVDTIICFRASTPLVIAVIEYFHLGRELPSARSWLALGGVFAGVTAYTAADANFTAAGYAWLAIWYSFAGEVFV